MNIISVINRSARAVDRDILTSGSVGIEVNFQFDDTWEGLDKVVSFTNDIDESGYDQNLFGSDTATIPAEVMTEAHRHVYVGVTGTKITHNDDGSYIVEIIIPTVYADLGVICQGAITNGENSSPITATDKEQITAAANEAITIANSAKNVADEVARKAAEGEFDGKDGADGNDYILTEQDKQDIADMVHVEGGGGFYDDTELRKLIEGVEDEAYAAKSRADTAYTTASTAASRAASAVGTASSAATTANNAKTAAQSASFTATEAKTIAEGKQDKLTAGTGINISEDNVISATGGGGFSGDYNDLTNKPVIPNVPNIVVLSEDEYALLCESGEEDENTIYIIPEVIA